MRVSNMIFKKLWSFISSHYHKTNARVSLSRLQYCDEQSRHSEDTHIGSRVETLTQLK